MLDAEPRGEAMRDAARRRSATTVMLSKLRLHALIRDVKEKGGRIVGISAPSRASTLVNYVGLDEAIIDYVCEIEGSLKIGKYMPGTLIPVVEESRMFADQPECAIIFSWHIADELAPKLRGQGLSRHAGDAAAGAAGAVTEAQDARAGDRRRSGLAAKLDRAGGSARSGQALYRQRRGRPRDQLRRPSAADSPDRRVPACARHQDQRPGRAAGQQFHRASRLLFRRDGLWRDHLHHPRRDEPQPPRQHLRAAQAAPRPASGRTGARRSARRRIGAATAARIMG